VTISAAVYRGDKTFAVERKIHSQPGAGEVQIDVAYCGICGTDLHIYLGHMDQRVGFQRTIGHEMSGVISALGPDVTRLKIGQHVVVRPLSSCGECPACKAGNDHICHNLTFIGIDTDGAFQEKWNVPAHTIHVLPNDLPLKHAALIEPLAVACHDVERGRVAPGEDVLVIGGGPIGLLVAIAARHAGASITISEISESRLGYAAQLGFSTINPASTNAAEAIDKATKGKGADVVFEVSGSQAGVNLMTEVVAARGRIVMVAIHATKPSIDLFRFFWREIELLGARVYRPEDYDKAIELLTSKVMDAETFITDIRGLDDIQSAFEALASNSRAIKSMIQIGNDLT